MRLEIKLEKWSLPRWKEECWKVFSQYIRQKYANKNGYVKCYTCVNIKHYKEQQCGHGLGGRGNSILFDEELVRVQCPRCNLFLGGNYDVFHAKLIEENGLEWFKAKLRQKSQSKQYTRQDYIRMIGEYQNKINNL